MNDAAADLTIIPALTAEALSLRKIDDVAVHDANGGEEERPLYVGDIEFDGFAFRALPMAGTDDPVMLIGRDVLNDLVGLFDGPAQQFRLSAPATAPA